MDRRTTPHHRVVGPGVRRMTEQDLAAVVDCANRTQHRYAGIAVRTIESFAWLCLERPGVEPNGAFVFETPEGIVGYLVVRTTGEVLECGIDRQVDGGQVFEELIGAAERYALDAGAARLLVNLPTDRTDLAGAAEASGFAGSPARNLYVRPKDLVGMIQLLADASNPEPCDIGFEVTTPTESEHVRLRLQDGTAKLGGFEEAEIRVTIDRGTLTGILFTRRSVSRALADRTMRVIPFRRIPTVGRVLRSLSVRADWFFHRSDIL